MIIRSISPLDPSGWVRVNLERDPNVPLPPVNRAAASGAAPPASQEPAPAQPVAPQAAVVNNQPPAAAPR